MRCLTSPSRRAWAASFCRRSVASLMDQHGPAWPIPINQGSCSEKHGALADFREVMLHLKVDHGRAVRYHLFQEQAQPGIVPLAISKLIDRSADRLGPVHNEGPEKGRTCLQYAQALIKDNQRVGSGIDDPLQLVVLRTEQSVEIISVHRWSLSLKCPATEAKARCQAT